MCRRVSGASGRWVTDQRGVTLVELVISIVVISIALAGTLAVMRRTTASSADPMIVRQAVGVAEAYLEEILLKPYYDPVAGAGGGVCPAPDPNGRPEYNNVCDYDGLDDSGARDQDDNPVTGLGRYRVRVSVDDTATLGSLSGPADVVRADVRVTHDAQVDFTLSGYRANY